MFLCLLVLKSIMETESLGKGLNGKTYRERELERLEMARQTEDGDTTGHYGDDAKAYRRDAKIYWADKMGPVSAWGKSFDNIAAMEAKSKENSRAILEDRFKQYDRGVIVKYPEDAFYFFVDSEDRQGLLLLRRIVLRNGLANLDKPYISLLKQMVE